MRAQQGFLGRQQRCAPSLRTVAACRMGPLTHTSACPRQEPAAPCEQGAGQCAGMRRAGSQGPQPAFLLYLSSATASQGPAPSGGRGVGSSPAVGGSPLPTHEAIQRPGGWGVVSRRLEQTQVGQLQQRSPLFTHPPLPPPLERASSLRGAALGRARNPTAWAPGAVDVVFPTEQPQRRSPLSEVRGAPATQ